MLAKRTANEHLVLKHSELSLLHKINRRDWYVAYHGKASSLLMCAHNTYARTTRVFHDCTMARTASALLQAGSEFVAYRRPTKPLHFSFFFFFWFGLPISKWLICYILYCCFLKSSCWALKAQAKLLHVWLSHEMQLEFHPSLETARYICSSTTQLLSGEAMIAWHCKWKGVYEAESQRRLKVSRGVWTCCGLKQKWAQKLKNKPNCSKVCLLYHALNGLE